MSRVKFIKQFNLFMEYAQVNELSMQEIGFWLCLFYRANRAAIFDVDSRQYEWPDEYFSVSHADFKALGQLDRQGVIRLRSKLQERGLIEFINGDRRSRNPLYRMFYLAKTEDKIEPMEHIDDMQCAYEGGIVNNNPNDAPREKHDSGGLIDLSEAFGGVKERYPELVTLPWNAQDGGQRSAGR